MVTRKLVQEEKCRKIYFIISVLISKCSGFCLTTLLQNLVTRLIFNHFSYIGINLYVEVFFCNSLHSNKVINFLNYAFTSM